GVRVGVIEGGAGSGPFDNPSHLVCSVEGLTYCNTPASHGTDVVGVLCSDRNGIARASRLWYGSSCNGDATRHATLSGQAATWGAKVLNLSFGSVLINGQPGGLDAFYDSLSYHLRRTVVAAAGNNTPVASPATGYNVIAVGNLDPRGTDDWSDDVMAPS